MPMSNAADITLTTAPRRFVEVGYLSLLARMQVGNPTCKPTGAKRWQSKIARALYRALHGHLGIPAQGRLIIHDAAEKRTPVRIDAGQSVYINFAGYDRHGGYEPSETLLMDALLTKASVFFDVGANWGYYTLLAATHPCFDGTVFAFEILPAMNEAMAMTIQQLGIANVRILNVGLSERSGVVAIFREHHAQLTRIVEATPPNRETMTARVETLDGLDLPPPDLIKIDVEDHECAVLQGGTETIARHCPAVLFESRSPESGAVAFLSERDYHVFAIRAVSADSRWVTLR